MVRYILVRIFLFILTLGIVFTVLYYAMNLVMIRFWGPRPYIPFPDNFAIVWERYTVYLSGVLTEWDWGTTRRGENVWETFREKAPITLRVNIATFIVYLTLGTLLGFISALKRNTFIDRFISSFTLIFGSLPSFILIFPLVIIFGFQLGWLPRRYPPEYMPYKDLMIGLIIPVIALAGPAIARVTRLVRGELIETMNAEYMMLARVKGLNKRQALRNHSLKNALVPILTELPFIITSVLMFSFFVEPVYMIRGVAIWFLDHMYDSYDGGGYFLIHVPIAIVVSMFYAIIGLTVKFVCDLIQCLLDPRISLGINNHDAMD